MEKKIIPREKSQNLKTWDLTSFGAPKKPKTIPQPAPKPAAPAPKKESESVSIPKIALPTAEELEKLHGTAYKEGHETGFAAGYNEGLEKGYAAGFAEGEKTGKTQGYDAGLESGKTEGFAQGKSLGLTEGKAQGFKSGEEALNQEKEALHNFSEHFRESLKNLEKNIAQDVLKLAVAIAQAVLHKELSLPESHLTPILQDALSALPNNASKIVVRLNPADRAFLKDEDFPPNVFDFVEDKRITRGGCQIDLGESSLDARIENRWQRTLSALGDTTPWSDHSPFGAANQSVVSENPALSSYLEKNLLANNPPPNLPKDSPLAVDNPELLAKKSAPHPNPAANAFGSTEPTDDLDLQIALSDDLWIYSKNFSQSAGSLFYRAFWVLCAI